MKSVLNITVFFESEERMRSLIAEVLEALQENNKGSIQVGQEKAIYSLGPDMRFQITKEREKR